MLTSKERVQALMINLSSWNWNEFSKFPISKEDGDALIVIFDEMKAENQDLKRHIEANKLLSGGFR